MKTAISNTGIASTFRPYPAAVSMRGSYSYRASGRMRVAGQRALRICRRKGKRNVRASRLPTSTRAK